MPEYDAFGRRIGEDPLSELGWSSGLSGVDAPSEDDAPEQPARITVGPAETPALRRDDRPAGDRPPPLRSPAEPPGVGLAPQMPDVAHAAHHGWRWLRRGVRLAVVAVFVVVAVQAISAGTGVVREAVDDVRDALPAPAAGVGADPDAGAAGGTGAAGGRERRARRGPSLLTRSGLAAGLRRLRRDAPGRLRMLRVEAERIDVSLHVRGGRIRSAQFARGADAARVLSTSGGGFTATGLFGYDDAEPAAAERIVRAANARLGRRTRDVDYLVLSRFGDALTWGVYYENGAIAQGDGRGRFVRRVS